MFLQRVQEGQYTNADLGAMKVDAEASEIEAIADRAESFISRIDASIHEVSSKLKFSRKVLSAASRALGPLVSKSTPAHEHAPVGAKVLPKKIKAALAKEKSMLAGLLSHLKSNIMSFNKEEQKGKDDSEKMLQKLQKRLARDQQSLGNPKISAFEHVALVNQTRMEETEVKYWMQSRDNQHSMFHSNLKMTHGLMSHVKTVLEAYSMAISKGSVDPKLLKSVSSVALPTAFVEMRRTFKNEAHEYRRHLFDSAALLAHP